MTRAIVFPGQGSQAVGMGCELADACPAAREVFDVVDEALGQKLSRLMFEGPDDELILTENAQPALLTHSIAALCALKSEGFDLEVEAAFVAGHSLGEYTAFVAAGTLSLADAAILVRTRGRAMQQAVPVGDGAMAVLLGLELADAEAVAAEASKGEVCDFANDNALGQVVISGDASAVERAVEIAKKRGAKRAVLLPVSAPFHCALMAPAADIMVDALAAVEMKDPAVPVISNVTAALVADAAEARERLVEQVTGRVRWRESVVYMRDRGVEDIVEVGTGKVLAGLARRIDRDLSAVSIGGPAEIKEFLGG